MKYIAIIVLFFISSTFAQFADAQTLEVQIRQADGAWSTVYDIYAADRLGESNFGIQAFGVISEGWGELYTGPTYTPTPWLELGLMAGVQATSPIQPRYAASLWSGHGRFSTLAWVEFDHNGVDGVWYDINARYKTLSWLSAGVRARRFFGTGPTLWTTIPKTPLGIWLSWTPVGFEETTDLTRGVGGITFTF